MKLIFKLPYDIRRKIFVDHYLYNLKYEKLLNILKTEKCMCLDISELIIYVNDILMDNYYINYIRNKNTIFDNIYTKHFINNDKCFVNLSINKSLALSWLMHLYH